MKKIVCMLCMLPLLMVACKKDKNEKGSGGIANYYIRGKMKSLVLGDNGAAWPFMITFGTDGKAKLLNAKGITTLNYTATNDKITLNEQGYFNLENKQITDWTIAGMNITSATLLPVGANQLRGKRFQGPVRWSEDNFDFTFDAYFDANTDFLRFSSDPNIPGFNFEPYAGVGVHLYDEPSQSHFFGMYYDGKFEISTTEQAGYTLGTLSVK